MLRLRTSQRLVMFAVILTVGIGVAFLKIIDDIRNDAWNHAVDTGNNIATTVQQAIERNFELYDLALQGILDDLNNPDILALPPALRNRALFDKSLDGLGFGATLVLNEQGEISIDSESTNPRHADFSDRMYFQVHQKNPSVGLYVSPPFRSRLTGELTIALSRRISRRDGSFGGVVIGSVRLSYIQQMLSQVKLGPDSGVSLFLTDGTVLVRFPYPAQYVGRNLTGTANFERMVRAQAGSFNGNAAIDGIDRLYNFHKIGPYPLIVNVAQSRQTILASWIKRAILLGVITLVLMAGCVALAALFMHELRARQKTAVQLARAESDLRSILNNLPAMVGYWDKDLRNRFGNYAYVDWFGVSPEQMTGRHIREILGEKLYASNEYHMRKALAGELQTFESTIVDPSGAIRHAINSYIPDAENGQVRGFFVMVTDISARKRAEEALFEEKERMRVTLGSIGDAVVTTNVNGQVTYLNPVAESMTGWLSADAQDKPVDDIMTIVNAFDDFPVVNPIRLALEQRRIVGLASNSCLVAKDGTKFPIEDSAAPITDSSGAVIGAVMVFHDVSETRAMALRMAHLAQHDALTDLPNRVLLQDRASQAIVQADRDRVRLAVMYLDLDRFKHVNDSLGHDTGDRLLIEVAGRLSASLRKSDTLSRQGGDEFVILTSAIDDPADAGHLAQKLIDVCARPFLVDHHALAITLSVGISIFPDDGTSFDELARHADAAMYLAKQSGRNQLRYFTAELGVAAARKMSMEKDLNRALDNGEFFLEYQPQIAHASGMLAGFEAMVRWNRAGDVVLPKDFIALAEETGQIIELGKFVLAEACRQMRKLQDAGMPAVPVAVNISARQFADPGFVGYLAATLQTSGLAPNCLELEITESTLMNSVEHGAGGIAQIKQLGVSIAIEDFGTGYSSLAYLHQLPVHRIKIDKAFVQAMTARNDVGIVQTIIGLAKHMGLDVVAKGVETQGQAEQLALLQCDHMQGDYYSHPLTSSALAAWPGRFQAPDTPDTSAARAQ